MLCMGTHELMQNFKQKLSEQRLTYHSCHRFCGNALLRTTFSFVLIFFFSAHCLSRRKVLKTFDWQGDYTATRRCMNTSCCCKILSYQRKMRHPFPRSPYEKLCEREREYHCIHVGSTAADNEHTQKTYTENTVLISINNRQHN